MKKYIAILGILTIWGLLIWGNITLTVWANNDYQERMSTNYLVNSYEGKLLLTQTEYGEFKRQLVSPEITIHNLDVYGSPDVLISYHITSPDYKEIPFVGSPQSQHWKYDQDRVWDYFTLGLVGLLSLGVGAFLSSTIIAIGSPTL